MFLGCIQYGSNNKLIFDMMFYKKIIKKINISKIKLKVKLIKAYISYNFFVDDILCNL